MMESPSPLEFKHGRPPIAEGARSLRGWGWFSASSIPLIVGTVALGMPGCNDAGFGRTQTVALWQAYPGLAFEAAFHFLSWRPPPGFSWLPSLIGLPVGLAMVACPLVMLFAPMAARRRALAWGGWSRKLTLADLTLLSPWGAVPAHSKHLLGGFYVATWACTAQFAVLLLAAVTPPRAVRDALPSPPRTASVGPEEESPP